jgi:hypothetical protein
LSYFYYYWVSKLKLTVKSPEVKMDQEQYELAQRIIEEQKQSATYQSPCLFPCLPKKNRLGPMPVIISEPMVKIMEFSGDPSEGDLVAVAAFTMEFL